MRVIVIGPPGAGKGTQCAVLSAKFDVPHISSGDLFRRAVAQQTPVGQQLADILRKGELVPDEVAIVMLRQRLNYPDCKKGFFLDGFPRTYTQAIGLGKAMIEDGVRVDHVVLLDLPDSEVTRRVTGRRMDPETGTIYHLETRPPPADVAERVIRRDDDTPEACAAMLAGYHKQAGDLISLYEDRDMLIRVDASGKPDEVTARLLAALGQ